MINRRDFVAVSAGALAVGYQQADAAQPAVGQGATPGAAPGIPPRAAPQMGAEPPLRFEASIEGCEVTGTVPKDMNGAFYRVGGEWYFPPLFADDAILNMDGYVSMFRFKNGRVDYRGRWIETERLQNERKAGRQLYGYYRNPYTDDPSVSDPAHPNRRTVSNTAPLAQGGKLFSLKEDGLPHRLDPSTLQTLGPWDFDGKWKSQTFTAHPKLDPVSGEMVAYGYEATGPASDDLWIYTVSAKGQVTREVRAKVPYVSMLHDCALTQKHILIPLGGYVTSKERLMQGKIHWGWDDSKPAYIGVIPRDGEGKDMRWFKVPLRCMMHTFNAYDEGNKVVLYAPFWESNFFPFFPPVDGKPWNPAGARAYIRKITLDLNSKDGNYTEELLWPMQVVDLGKVDPRVTSLKTRYLYTGFRDPDRPAAGPGGGFGGADTYGRFDLQTGKVDKFYAGPTHSLQEVSFVPRKGGDEGSGYLVGVASNSAERRAELVIFDAQRPVDGEVARVLLPFRISSQVHGVWASADELAFS